MPTEPVPITQLTVPGAGSITITHHRGAIGAGLADVRLTIVLPDHAGQAQARLAALTTHLHTLIGPARPPAASRG